jgi:hypothetical protein
MVSSLRHDIHADMKERQWLQLQKLQVTSLLVFRLLFSDQRSATAFLQASQP